MPSSARAVALLLAAAAAGATAGLLLEEQPQALPQYAAQAGRTCDNCHSDPTGWINPALPQRLCTLSCSGCHVDPAGGGLRTVSGMYYGHQTLPAFGATLRPWSDRDAHLFGLLPPRDWDDSFRSWDDVEAEARALDEALGRADGEPTSVPSQPTSMPSQPTSMPSQPTSMPSQPTSMPSQPTSVPPPAGAEPAAPYRAPGWQRTPPEVDRFEARAQAGPDRDLLAWGHPLGEPSVHAFDPSRYHGLNPDPLVRLGLDARYAAYGADEGWKLFPMQLDLGLGLHPVEHLTAYVEGAAWGGQDGAGTQVAGEPTSLIGLHEAFLMTHEWPFNSYLKAGRFMPQFGTRLDDHTAFVRRNLGFDQGRPSNWASGVELGLDANYPYFSAAVFRTNAGQTDFWPEDSGTGASATAGWRDLAWGVGTSFYTGELPDLARTLGGLSWYLNPWRLSGELPFAYLGELDYAAVWTPAASQPAHQLLAFHEVDWYPLNGLDFRLRWDFVDPDLEVALDQQHRLNLQLDLHPYRYLELQLLLREHLPAAGAASTDFLTILRAWL